MFNTGEGATAAIGEGEMELERGGDLVDGGSAIGGGW